VLKHIKMGEFIAAADIIHLSHAANGYLDSRKVNSYREELIREETKRHEH
jgi:hypothetical protein